MRFEEVETSSQEMSDGQISDFSFRTYPQGFAQLLPVEGALRYVLVCRVINDGQHGTGRFLDCARNDRDGRDLR